LFFFFTINGLFGIEKKIKKMEIIGVIASVIKNEKRLISFRLLLDSIRSQTTKLDGLIISSYIDPSFHVDSNELFSGLGANCHILLQKRAKRQFVQFKEISNCLDKKFPDFKNKFLLFSDDDDLWSPNRVFAYKQAENIINDITYAIVFKESTKQKIGGCKLHDETFGDVNEMFKCGCASFSAVGGDKPTHVEYHYYLVRQCVLADFVAKNRWLVEQNRFADMEFRIFVGDYKYPDGIKLHTSPLVWTYFYRFSHDSITGTRKYEDLAEYIVEQLECPSMALETRKHLIVSRKHAQRTGLLKEFDKCLIDYRNARKLLAEKEYNMVYEIKFK
jgi:hypothetical protein